MDPVTVLEILSCVFGGSVAGLGVVAGWGYVAKRRVLERASQRDLRKREACRTARWEPRARRVKGNVVIDVVRVARWDDQETVVEEDYAAPVVVPVSEPNTLMDAEANAYARSFDRNGHISLRSDHDGETRQQGS